MRAEAGRFAHINRHATGEAGTTTTVERKRSVNATSAVVEVDAVTPQMKFDSHQVGGVLARAQVENLPLNGRNFIELSKLEPGVTVPSTRPSFGRQLVPVMGSPAALEG